MYVNMINTRIQPEEKEEKEKRGKLKSTKQSTQQAIYIKKFKWPRNLQDPKPVIKDKQVKTEITFLIYQIGKNVIAWWFTGSSGGVGKDITLVKKVNLHILSRVSLDSVYQSLKCFYPLTQQSIRNLPYKYISKMFIQKYLQKGPLIFFTCNISKGSIQLLLLNIWQLLK